MSACRSNASKSIFRTGKFSICVFKWRHSIQYPTSTTDEWPFWEAITKQSHPCCVDASRFAPWRMSSCHIHQEKIAYSVGTILMLVSRSNTWYILRIMENYVGSSQVLTSTTYKWPLSEANIKHAHPCCVTDSMFAPWWMSDCHIHQDKIAYNVGTILIIFSKGKKRYLMSMLRNHIGPEQFLTCTTDKWPFWAASIKDVSPCCVDASTFAPQWRSAYRTNTRKINGPVLGKSLTRAYTANRKFIFTMILNTVDLQWVLTSTARKWPFREASIKGEIPSCAAASTTAPLAVYSFH